MSARFLREPDQFDRSLSRLSLQTQNIQVQEEDRLHRSSLEREHSCGHQSLQERIQHQPFRRPQSHQNIGSASLT